MKTQSFKTKRTQDSRSIDREATMKAFHGVMLGGLSCLALAAAVSTAFAGNDNRVGTAGAQELRLPVSARGLALGDGFVADVSGAEAMNYNPAGVADVANVEVYFSHLSWIADMDQNYVSAVAKTSWGVVGASVNVLSVGDIEETTEDRPEGTGRMFSPNFTTIGVNYSRYLTDAISVGVLGKVLSERVLQTNATGVAFDVGLRYRLSNKLRMALVLKHFGPDMKFDGSDFESFHLTGDNPQANPRSLASLSSSFDLPAVFQIGAGYSIYDAGQNKVQGYGSFMSNTYSRDEYQFGGEYNYGQTLALRAGIAATGDSDYNFGPTFGVGFGVPLGGSSFLNVDYGHRVVKDFFDDNQLLALKFTF